MTEELPRSCDVAIVGGGILGCSTAWHLAASGAGRVVLVEAGEQLGCGATSKAAALVAASRRKDAQIPLVRQTLRDLETLGDDSSLGVRRCGSIELAASDSTAAALDPLLERAARHGLPGIRLSTADAAARLPWLEHMEVRDAAFFAADVTLDTHALTQAYARAARRDGAVVRTGEPATLDVRAGRIAGLRLRTGRLAAGTVVLAAGTWSQRLVEPLGLGLPYAPVRSHYWITAPHGDFPADMPFVTLRDANAYLRAEAGGAILGLREPVSTALDPRTMPEWEEPAGLDLAEDGLAMLAASAERLSLLIRPFAELGWRRFVGGLTSYTPDGMFIVGRHGAVDGLVVVGGCCGTGIAASGGLGTAAAQAVTGHGDFELAPFAPDRFGALDPSDPAHLRRCAESRGSKLLS